jgi:putative MATE family efflux protein
MLTVIIVGLAMGTTVLTAQSVGANDAKRTTKVVGNTITLFLAFSVVMSLVLLITVGDIVKVMSTPAEAVGETTMYLIICFAGVPFIVAYNIIASIFRGMGDTRSPLYFVMVACVVNIVLDYVLIGGMGMGATGAAVATVLSQTVSVIVALVVIKVRKNGMGVTRADLQPQKAVMGQMLKIGVPVALQDGFIQIAFLVITIIANLRGLNDAAAVGIVEKVIGVLFLIPSSMLSTVSAVSAQNLGAKKVDRAKKTLWEALGITVGFGLVFSIVIQFVAGDVVSLFTSESEVIRLGDQYLRGYVWDCVLAGIHFCFSGFFCACGWSILSFIHNVVAIVLARVPLAYLASIMYPETLYPMGMATNAGSLLSVIICVVAYAWLIRQKKLEKFA